MYKYFIACSNPLLAMGIETLVAGCGMDTGPVGREENEEKAFAQIQVSRPDFVIADTALTARINDRRPDVARLRERICAELNRKIFFLYILHRGGWQPDPAESYCAALYADACATEPMRAALCGAFRQVDAYRSELRLLGRDGLRENEDLLLHHALLRLLGGTAAPDRETRALLERSEMACPGDCFQALLLGPSGGQPLGCAAYQKALYLVKQHYNGLCANFTLGVNGQICVVLITAAPLLRDVLLAACTAPGRQGSTAGFFLAGWQCGIGPAVQGFSALAYSYACAQAALGGCAQGDSLSFAENGAPPVDYALLQTRLNDIFARHDAAACAELLAELRGTLPGMLRGDIRHSLGVLTQSYLAACPGAEHRLLQALGKTPCQGATGWQALYAYRETAEYADYLEKLGTLLCGYLLREQKNGKNDLFARAQGYIEEHLADALTLEKVADRIGVSPNYLSAVFRRCGKTGFSEYVTAQKIRRACELMQGGERRICTVSEAVGYATPQYFSKVFKKVTGVRPSDYLQKQNEPRQ